MKALIGIRRNLNKFLAILILPITVLASGCGLKLVPFPPSYVKHPAPGQHWRGHVAHANTSPTPPPQFAPFLGNLSAVTAPFSATGLDFFLLQRQADCSLTYLEFSAVANSGNATATVTPVSQIPHYERTIHNNAFLTTTSGVFAQGCTYNNAGNTSQLLADVGTGKNGRELLATQGTNGVLASGIKSDGTYSPSPQYSLATELQPVTMVGADLNGDGNPDLVSVNTSGLASSITVFLGNSDGSYQAGTNLALPGSAAQWAVIDDLNGDGKPDILASSGDQFTVFLGKGDGTFQAAQTFTPAGGTLSFFNAFITADVNGDGKKDIVTATGLVFLGQGDGITFTPVAQSGIPAITSATSNFAPDLVAADFNKDGKLDLAIDDGTVIHTFQGNGDGTFTVGPAYATIADYGFLIAMDIDGDGNVDLWSGPGGGAGLGSDEGTTGYALMGNGDGTFQGAPALPASYTGTNLADLNGDGRPDLVGLAAGVTSTFTTYLTNASGIPVAGPQLAVPVGVYVDSFALGAYHGGTRDDLIFLSAAPQIQSYYLAMGNGDGSFQTPIAIATPSLVPSGLDINEMITGLQAADLNHDGKIDLIASFSDQDGMSQLYYQGFFVQLGNGDGTFQAPKITITYQSATAPQIFSSNQLSGVSDVTGDNFPDVFMVIPNGIVNGTAQHQTQLFVGKGDGTFNAGKVLTLTGNILPVSPTEGGSPFAFADLNGDGKMDLVASGSSSDGTTPQMAIALGNGDGTFQAPTILTFDGFGYVSSPAIADFNGDGKLDLLVQGIIEGTGTGILLGNGDGTFQTLANGDGTVSASELFAVTLYGGAVAVDLNRDGQPDLLVGNVVLLNKTGAMVAPTPAATSTAVSSSANPSTSGASVTFTATVTSTTAGTITGTVTFLDGGNSIGSGAVNASGVATFMTTSLSTGPHSITAQYGGDTNYAASTSAALTQTVNAVAAATTSTALSASPNPASVGVSVTFSATVTSMKAGTITGNVTFLDGANSLGMGTVGAGGLATFMTSSLAAGAHSITAQYGGDANYAVSSSAAVTETINSGNPDFTVSANPTALTIVAGQSGNVTLTVTPVNGSTQPVAFACANLPVKSSCAFAPALVTLDGTHSATTQMTLSTTGRNSSGVIVGSIRPEVLGRLMAMLVFALAGIVSLLWNHRGQRPWKLAMGFAVLAMVVCLVASCANSSTGTPQGTTQISLRAAGPNDLHTISVTITVQ